MTVPTREGYRLTVVPFSGFCGTHHGDAMDQAEQYLAEDENGEFMQGVDDIYERVWMGANSKIWRENYAAAYVESFAGQFGIEGMEFESLDSPQFYNFATDRIFAWLPEASLRDVIRRTDRAILEKVAADNLTSHSGFISFYSPDVSEWAELDHNLIGLILEAFVKTKSPEWNEFDLTEEWQCNGYCDNWLWDCLSDDAKAAANDLSERREALSKAAAVNREALA